MDFDTKVKLHIYQTLAETSFAPTASEIGTALGSTREKVLAAFQRLHQKRLFVPEPGDSERIRMAPPFSGVKTPFQVEVSGKSYYANCIWDAYGIPAALGQDGDILTECGNSKEPMKLQVRDSKPVPQACAIHFAVPAAHWWDDIIYT